MAGATPATRSTQPAEPLHTGDDLLTGKQTARMEKLFDGDTHVQVEAIWGVYQRMILAYRDAERRSPA